MADRYWVAGGTGNYNSTTNWSATSGGASGASVPSTVDNVFFNASSGVGIATINVASFCANLNLTGFLGTLSFTNNLSTLGTVNFGTGGYTETGTGALRFQSATTITSNGSSWSGNIIFAANGTFTLADNFTITGNLIFEGGFGATINGNTLNIGSNLTNNSSSTTSGTTVFNFNGTGTWSHSSSGNISNPFIINTPAGTLTISGTVYKSGATFTYTAGTVVTTGSTLNIGAATTLNTNGIIWNNITATGVMTLGSNLTLTGTLTTGTAGTLSFTLGGFNLISTNANLTIGTATFTMPTNQTFKTLIVTGTGNLNSNTLTITENLTINNTVSGTTTIVYAGTGTWTALNSSATINNNFTINTPFGTLTITGNVYKTGNTFTYIAGNISDTFGAVITGNATTCNVSGVTWTKFLVGGTTTLTSNINAVTFGTALNNNITFTLGGNTLNFTHLELGSTNTTTLPTNWIAQNVELVNIANGVLNGNSITITGNFTQSANGAYSGTTTFTYAVPALSTGTWSNTGNGRLQNNLTINSAGTINFNGGHIGAGIFTYTAGTFNCQIGSTLYNSVLGTIFNGAGITWYNVVFGLPSGLGGGTSVILNTQLICIGTLTLNLSQTAFSGTDGTFDTYDFVLGSDASALRTTTLVSAKTYRVRQSFTCTQSTDAFRILLKSSIGGSQAIFTLDSGATIDVGFVNATDINSSLGRTIYSYDGVLTNTLNWGMLPTDNIKSGRFVYA